MLVRFGIIGTGTIAVEGHAPAIAALGNATLTAVLSRNTDNAKAFLANHGGGGGGAHADLDSFSASRDFDCAIITSPDKLHAQQALACLNAGKHVLLEKPMATSLADAEALVAAAERNHRMLAVGFHLRGHAGHQALHEQIHRRNAIGVLRHIRIQWARAATNYTPGWRTDGGTSEWWSLAAVGSHCFDLARWLANDMADWRQFSAITAHGVFQNTHDETAQVAAQFASGVTLDLTSSIQFGGGLRIEVYGDKGMAVAEGPNRMGSQSITVNGEPLPFIIENPFVTQLRNVITSIETGTPPLASGAVGLRSVKDLLLAST